MAARSTAWCTGRALSSARARNAVAGTCGTSSEGARDRMIGTSVRPCASPEVRDEGGARAARGGARPESLVPERAERAPDDVARTAVLVGRARRRNVVARCLGVALVRRPAARDPRLLHLRQVPRGAPLPRLVPGRRAVARSPRARQGHPLAGRRRGSAAADPRSGRALRQRGSGTPCGLLRGRGRRRDHDPRRAVARRPRAGVSVLLAAPVRAAADRPIDARHRRSVPRARSRRGLPQDWAKESSIPATSG